MKCGQGERLGVWVLLWLGFKLRLQMIRAESGEGGGEDKGVGWGKEGCGGGFNFEAVCYHCSSGG
jgi:hypothetical protein